MMSPLDLPTINDVASIDFETNSLQYWKPDFKAIGAGVAAPGIAPFYLDFNQNPQFIQWVIDTIPNILWINHHVKFDWHVAMAIGARKPPKSFHCTMVTEALIDEHRIKYGLDAVAMERTGRGKTPLPPGPIHELPPEILAAYGANDADLALNVYFSQLKDVADQQLDRVLAMEMQLLPVLADMEHKGVRVDIEAAEAAIPRLTELIDEGQKKIDTLVGRPFNVNSTPQIRGVFNPKKVSNFQYQLIDGTLCELTKTGGPCIDQNVLKEMTHPLAAMIRRQRKLIKTRDTFILGHILGHQYNGYVHTTFNQTKGDNEAGTGTGRMSSIEPALQQINGRDVESADIIRSAFLPDNEPGHEWYATDYSQVDFRMCAHLIQDDRLTQIYQENPKTDFHRVVSEMTSIPRDPEYAGGPNTKQLNLSLSFGAGPGKAAKMIGMPYTVEEGRNGRAFLAPGPEAQKIFTEYHARFPRMKKFAAEARDVAQSRGYVLTRLGRRLRFPRKDYHKAAGLLYQAYAAEQHKIGLINVHKAIKGRDARLMLSVHDECGISMPRDPVLAEEIRTSYCHNELNLRIPILASGKFGLNWRQATKK